MGSRGGWDGVCCGIKGWDIGRFRGWCRRLNVRLLAYSYLPYLNLFFCIQMSQLWLFVLRHA